METDRQKKVLPAPLLVVACLLLGLAAQLLHPIRFLPDFGIAGALAGIIVGIASLAVGLSGVREFKRHNTPTNPFQPVTALVTSGVFRHTRNPMYLGFVALFIGIAIAVNSLAFLSAAGLLAILLQIAVIMPEERVLSVKYGSEFEAYCSRTRPWI